MSTKLSSICASRRGFLEFLCLNKFWLIDIELEHIGGMPTSQLVCIYDCGRDNCILFPVEDMKDHCSGHGHSKYGQFYARGFLLGLLRWLVLNIECWYDPSNANNFLHCNLHAHASAWLSMYIPLNSFLSSIIMSFTISYHITVPVVTNAQTIHCVSCLWQSCHNCTLKC